MDEAEVDVLRVGELVLVEDVVFYACADAGWVLDLCGMKAWDDNGVRWDERMNIQPKCPSTAVDQQSSSREDGDLSVGRIINIMIRSPEPSVLHIQTRSTGGDVHTHIRTRARRVRGTGRALRVLQVRADKTSNSGVDIPHPGWRARCVEIPLDQDGASLRALC